MADYKELLKRKKINRSGSPKRVYQEIGGNKKIVEEKLKKAENKKKVSVQPEQKAKAYVNDKSKKTTIDVKNHEKDKIEPKSRKKILDSSEKIVEARPKLPIEIIKKTESIEFDPTKYVNSNIKHENNAIGFEAKVKQEFHNKKFDSYVSTDRVLEFAMKKNLTHQETRIILAILLKTRAGNPEISGSEFEKMTDIKREHCTRAIKSLVEKSVISKNISSSGKNTFRFGEDF